MPSYDVICSEVSLTSKSDEMYRHCKMGKNLFFGSKERHIAEEGFDPPTSGLWAQHASAAPLCWE